MSGSLKCLICGEEVRLSGRRLRELVSTGCKPVCRKNGCFRAVGFREQLGEGERPGTARVPQVVLRQKVAMTCVTEGPRGVGKKGQPLASRKVRRSVAGICDVGGRGG
jgi:hypothetical protein